MTGPEHYREAERMAQWAGDYDEEAQPDNAHIQAGQLAQVHALLAVAAATALGREGADRTQPDEDAVAWFDVAAECRKAQQ